MFTQRAAALAVVLGLACTVPGATAWWAAGHETVAAVAAGQLTPQARTAVANLLAVDAASYPYESSTPAVADWMDLIKSGTDAFNTWHYADVPLVLNTTSGGLSPAPGWTDAAALSALVANGGDKPNLVWALTRCFSALAPASKAAPSLKAFYLRVVFHLMGDMHQPCHTAASTLPDGSLDAGCNRISLSPAPKVGPTSTAGNLHAFWDAGAGALGAVPAPYPPVPAGSSGVSDADIANFVNGLATEIAAAKASQPAVTASQLTDRNNVLLLSWFTDSMNAAVSTVFRPGSPVMAAVQAAAAKGPSYGSVVVNTNSPDWPAYTVAASALARTRMAVGGIRLGQALNALLTYDVPPPSCGAAAPPPPPPPPVVTCPPPSAAPAGPAQGTGSKGILAAAVIGWLLAIVAAGCAVVPRLRGDGHHARGASAGQEDHAELLPTSAGERRMSLASSAAERT